MPFKFSKTYLMPQNFSTHTHMHSIQWHYSHSWEMCEILYYMHAYMPFGFPSICWCEWLSSVIKWSFFISLWICNSYESSAYTFVCVYVSMYICICSMFTLYYLKKTLWLETNLINFRSVLLILSKKIWISCKKLIHF